jgi:cytochrome c biogenesis protein CcdA
MDNSVIEVRDKDRKRFRVNYPVLGLFFGVVSQPCRLQLRHARLAAHANLGERVQWKDHKVVVEGKYSFF